MKLSERLQWIFAALVLFCGIPLIFFDKESPDQWIGQSLAGLASILLGGFVFCLSWNALETGILKVQHLRFNRRSQPRSFFATVTIIMLAGCSTLFTDLWFILFK